MDHLPDVYLVRGKGQRTQEFSSFYSAEFFALRMSQAIGEELFIIWTGYDPTTGKVESRFKRKVKPHELRLNPAYARQQSRRPVQSPPAPPSPYALSIRFLSILEPFTQQDLKSAYRMKAASAHPDLGGSADLFRQLTEHYELIIKTKGWTL